jgi:hypothetical protein
VKNDDMEGIAGLVERERKVNPPLGLYAPPRLTATEFWD